MEKSIYGYIIRYSKRQQIALTLLAIASYPFLLGFLNVPKWIVNHIKDAVDKKGVSFQVEIDVLGIFNFLTFFYRLLLFLLHTYLD